MEANSRVITEGTMDALLTLPEASRMAGISPTTARRWIASGALKASKDKDGAWLIREEELRAFMVSTLALRKSSCGGLQRAGAEGKAPPGATTVGTTEVLMEALRREKEINDELRAQNKELQAELLKLNAEMLAILKGEGKNLLSRWFKK